MQSNEADELTGCVLLNRPEPSAPLAYEHNEQGKHRSGIGLVATLKLERGLAGHHGAWVELKGSDPLILSVLEKAHGIFSLRS